MPPWEARIRAVDPTLSLTLMGAAAAVTVYAHGFRRLRRRGRHYVTWSHAALYLGGVAVGVAAVSPPLDALADRSLAAHMCQHLLLGDVMPLLLVLGIRGPMSVFFLPAPLLRRVGRRPTLAHVTAVALRPGVAFAAWMIVIGAWHLPFAYDFALTHEPVHAVEHLSFVLVGLLIWTIIVAPAPHQRLSAGRRAVFAGAILLAGMVMSEVLLVAHPLYAHYRTVVDRPLGFSAAEDQNRAALIMMAEQAALFGTAAALLLWTHVENVSAVWDS
jgi:cytochrome c oxidase assembly factor CtaG